MTDKVSEWSTDKSDKTVELFIEPYEHTDEADLEEDLHTMTDTYEMVVRDGTLYRDLIYSIHEVEGTCFRVEPDEGDTCTISYICIASKRGDDGEVIVPDDPFDKGEHKVEAGEYRMWDTYVSAFDRE